MIKRGRTLKLTIDELFESPRYKIAIKAAQTGDNSFMLAILVELGLECFRVAKYKTIKAHNMYSSLPDFEKVPFMKNVGNADSEFQFDSFNLWWGLSDLEKQIYNQDPKNKKSPEEYQEMILKLQKKMMGS